MHGACLGERLIGILRRTLIRSTNRNVIVLTKILSEEGHHFRFPSTRSAIVVHVEYNEAKKIRLTRIPAPSRARSPTTPCRRRLWRPMHVHALHSATFQALSEVTFTGALRSGYTTDMADRTERDI